MADWPFTLSCWLKQSGGSSSLTIKSVAVAFADLVTLSESLGFAHFDAKPENLVLRQKESGSTQRLLTYIGARSPAVGKIFRASPNLMSRLGGIGVPTLEVSPDEWEKLGMPKEIEAGDVVAAGADVYYRLDRAVDMCWIDFDRALISRDRTAMECYSFFDAAMVVHTLRSYRPQSLPLAEELEQTVPILRTVPESLCVEVRRYSYPLRTMEKSANHYAPRVHSEVWNDRYKDPVGLFVDEALTQKTIGSLLRNIGEDTSRDELIAIMREDTRFDRYIGMKLLQYLQENNAIENVFRLLNAYHDRSLVMHYVLQEKTTTRTRWGELGQGTQRVLRNVHQQLIGSGIVEDRKRKIRDA